MFRILTPDFLDLVFTQYRNSNWKVKAHKDGSSYELSRSIPDGDLPWVVSQLIRPTGETDGKKAVRKLKSLIKKSYDKRTQLLPGRTPALLRRKAGQN